MVTCLFRSLLDAAEHPPVHREADRLDERGSELQAGREVVGRRAAVPADHAAALGAERLDEEQPADVGPAVVVPVGAGLAGDVCATK